MLNNSVGTAARMLAAAGAAGPACGVSTAATGLAALSAAAGRLSAAASHSPAGAAGAAGVCRRCGSGSGCSCAASSRASSSAAAPPGAQPALQLALAASAPSDAANSCTSSGTSSSSPLSGASPLSGTSSSRGARSAHAAAGPGLRLGAARGSGLAALAGRTAAPSPAAAALLQPGSGWGAAATAAAARCVHAPAAASPPSDGAASDQLSLAALAAGLWEEMAGGREEGLTPAAIVAALDRHIVGQAAAKRAVAVALRNRWRRQRVEPAAFRDEIMPKNILMVGPTGCGKTEVARRLAKLADAPFVKVEATKYTELGYVGRDVEEIVKELVEAALVLVRSRAKERLAVASAARAEEVIVRALVGPHAAADIVDSFREMYRRGDLDSHTVDIEASLLEGTGGGGGGPFGGGGGPGGGGRMDLGPGSVILLDKLFARPGPPGGDRAGGGGGGGPGMGGAGGGFGAGGGRGGSGYKKTLKVSEARSRLEEAEAEKLLSSEAVTREALRAAEQDGIVFIDEVGAGGKGGGREG
ncbi:hypothetical protein HXX76_005920 [Chlamydomonas incerta]|uniref:ATPase AAA-type core domain-containing protein n=1 Tax=Chlamydomonas incerta TaxID=51695 RepID=A0A835T1S3_CHLIN|nr:hypothetical protein HXX76_005920 [Chlamydomonas incerta]|eukprot:KAG2437259.1 hypothetical protein HXX76_005920 [Chlamydomonas incerta]